MAEAKTVWLKKYTELEYLESILRNRHLHLGDPKTWPDKNDSKLVEMYSKKFNVPDIRGTCLTEAPDRFHFWSIFGKCEEGVCLWFEKNSLLQDIEKDKSLTSRPVKYCTIAQMRDLDADSVPFAKRAQYSDEREFHIIRKRLEPEGPNDQSDKFEFSISSLKGIYLNSWLGSGEVESWTERIKEYLDNDFAGVCVKQNKIINSDEWIKAAHMALEKTS